MEAVKNNFEVPQNTEIDEPVDADLRPKRLNDGISLKDLCDGKKVSIEFSSDDDDEEEEEEEEDDFEDEPNDVVGFYPSFDMPLAYLKTMRSEGGAPPCDKMVDEILKGMANVTEDGLVKKKILTKGTGEPVPNFAFVKVHYNLYRKSSTVPFDTTYLTRKPKIFSLDQGELIVGLEQAIKSMKKNENSMFYIKWEVAFGFLGCPGRIGEKCDIMADVTLLDFVNVDPQTAFVNRKIKKTAFYNRIEEAKCLFYRGEEEFLDGETNSAAMRYRRALEILNDLLLNNREEEKEVLKRKVRCLVNLAVCYNKLGKPKGACAASREALAIDWNNARAKFHYEKANIALMDLIRSKSVRNRAKK